MSPEILGGQLLLNNLKTKEREVTISLLNKAMKKQRKERTKLSKDTSIDIMKPISLELIGTANDPCFGKLNNPDAEECNRCGDCELCAIVQSQKLHVKRDEIESKQAFKDIQKIRVSRMVILKSLKKIIKKGSMPIPEAKDKVCKKLHIHESQFDKAFKVLTPKHVFMKYFIVKNNLIKRK